MGKYYGILANTLVLKANTVSFCANTVVFCENTAAFWANTVLFWQICWYFFFRKYGHILGKKNCYKPLFGRQRKQKYWCYYMHRSIKRFFVSRMRDVFFILVLISSGTLDVVMWQAKVLPGPVGPRYPGNTYLCSSSKIFNISLNTEKTISWLLLCVFLQRGLTMFSRSPQVIWEQNTYNRRKNQVKVQQYYLKILILYNKATKISSIYYMTVLFF